MNEPILCALQVTSSRTPQPPRSATFRSSRYVGTSLKPFESGMPAHFRPRVQCRLRLLGSPKPLGHAVQRLHGSVVRSSAATEAEPATPLVSQNAAQEVPHAEVATAEDLSAAMDKTKSGPNTNPNDQQQQQQRSPARASGGVRLGGRSKRPRTVQPEQLVPGAQFEGSVVRFFQRPHCGFHKASDQFAAAADASGMTCRCLCCHTVPLWTLVLLQMALFISHSLR